MRVRVVRRGGLAGIAMSATGESDELPAGALGALQEAVAQPAPALPGADRFSYEVTLGEGVAATGALLAESQLPEALRPLLDRLEPDG